MISETITFALPIDVIDCRMENEINRLNREIESLKRKQTVREEALMEEWREKMKRRERQFEEEFADLEENHRSFYIT